jgi:molybdenum cofactor synthesis domain-containing protein
MLRALAEAEAGEVSLLPTALDDLDGIKHVIETACDSADIAIITGGVSVGKYDLTKRALIELGAEIFFERVRLKPGKPAVFARLGDVLVFGLPGNPVSAAVTFYLFVRKALLLMQRARETDLHRGTAVANGVFKAAPQRDTYFPIRLEFGSDGRIAAEPVKWIGSSDFVGFGKSNALAFVPRGEVIQENEIVEIALLT